MGCTEGVQVRAIARERVEGEEARATTDSSDSSASSVWGRIGESKRMGGRGWEGAGC